MPAARQPGAAKSSSRNIGFSSAPRMLLEFGRMLLGTRQCQTGTAISAPDLAEIARETRIDRHQHAERPDGEKKLNHRGASAARMDGPCPIVEPGSQAA